MKFKSLLLLMLITASTFAQNAKKVNIPGFGELSAIQKGEAYSIKIADYGTFDFKGSISPISLETEATIAQLKKFPGYKVMSNLGLEEIWLKVSKEGLEVEAKANTKKSLGKLCKFLKIKSPYAEVAAKIGRASFELSGKLAFSDEPIKLLSVDKLGTKVSFYSAGLGAAFEPGSVEIGVTTEFKIIPTSFDPELTVAYEFKYDLLTQDITGAGSLMGKWVDPFGMDRFVAKNSVIFENGAVELGVNVVSLTPSNIGFALDRGKLFGLDFGIFMSVAPTDKSFAFYGESRTKLTLNLVSQILRNNFKLKVPDIFPKDYYLDSMKVKFATAEASVGEIELDKGFALAGAGKFKELDGFFDFNFDLENEFRLEMDFRGDYSKFIWNEAHKIKNEQAREIIKQALDLIEIQRMYMYLNAQKSMTLKGEMTCEFIYQNKLQKVSFKASLDAEQIAKNLINKLLDKFGGPVLDIAKKAGGEAKKIANNAAGEAGKLLEQAKTLKEHTGHSKNKCDTECVPRHARKLSAPIVEGSQDAVRKYYYKVYPKIYKIKGSTPAETRKMRSNLIKKDWDEIFVSIDNKWDKILKDKTYVRMYYKTSSATEGGHIFKREVNKYRKKDLDYRKTVWERMMKNTSKGQAYAGLEGTEIPEGDYYIQSVKAYGSDKGYLEFPGKNPEWKKKGNQMGIWSKDDNPNKRFRFDRYDFLSYYIIRPASDKNYAMDCKGGKSGKKTPLHLWSLHKGGSQNFFFKDLGGGKFAIVPRRNHKMCLALAENKNANNGNKVHLWEYSDVSSKQWFLINANTNKKFVSKKAVLKGTEIPEGEYYIQSVKAGNSDKGYLEFPGKNPTWKKKGNQMDIWSKDGNPNKKFRFHRNSHLSYYIITPESDEKYAIDCKGGESGKKTPLHLWSLHKGDAQQFFFKHVGGGKFAIVPRGNQKMCIALQENKNANNGNKVHLWTYSDASSKQWYLINVKTEEKFVPKK